MSATLLNRRQQLIGSTDSNRWEQAASSRGINKLEEEKEEEEEEEEEERPVFHVTLSKNNANVQ